MGFPSIAFKARFIVANVVMNVDRICGAQFSQDFCSGKVCINTFVRERLLEQYVKYEQYKSAMPHSN
jgi:hypothetical protein